MNNPHNQANWPNPTSILSHTVEDYKMVVFAQDSGLAVKDGIISLPRVDFPIFTNYVTMAHPRHGRSRVPVHVYARAPEDENVTPVSSRL